MAPADVKRKRARGFWPVARLALSLIIATAALGGIAVFAGKSAAWVGLAAILWFALFRMWKAEQRWEARERSALLELGGRYEAIISSLLAALELRANMSLQHSQGVSRLVSALGWQMGLRKQEVVAIEKAAMLHDVGKIGIAETVLSKPGALSDQEWSEMKRHPELGHYILRGVRELEDGAEIVYSHHERYDGAGYPRGLRGEEIPLGARIFAVIDAYVAMTSHRPYRKAQPHDYAMQEILRNAGSQFDPEVVRAFRDAEESGLLISRPDQDGAAAGYPPAVAAGEV